MCFHIYIAFALSALLQLYCRARLRPQAAAAPKDLVWLRPVMESLLRPIDDDQFACFLV